ncbi:hypothetical protein BDV29DRAFT_111042 [Aspergillus leporis]|jgi:hypothetical protein|uniref:Uncharacterized protein n=1 Tax=Aspergillus leporis TaxID=41062 RepID=A0A5N5XE69_9EURO|nr:hypothetical protein BDV29DRAFT_111042 [Aspergillus leporis]
MTSITCHPQPHGGYSYSLPHGDPHNNSNNSRPLHIVQTTVTQTTLGPGTGDTPSCLAGSQLPPSLDIPSPGRRNLSDTKTTLQLTEITVDACTSPKSAPALHDLAGDMAVSLEDSPTKHPNITPALSPISDKPRMSKRKRTSSPPSPSSAGPGHHRRSTSRSRSRQSSLHTHRRAATVTASLTPSVPSKDLEAKREDLLALHRKSCRLFQDSSRPIPTHHERISTLSNIQYSPTHTARTSSEANSPPISPVLRTQLSVISQGPIIQHDSKGPVLHTSSVTTIPDESYISPIQTSATVIDWTSPSTRRREYKKIDRASSGVRGFWRRVAPKWCQFGHDRTPFFEEKGGKGNYEGSVRRFRMNLPDEHVPGPKMGAIRALKLKQKLVTSKMSTRRQSE